MIFSLIKSTNQAAPSQFLHKYRDITKEVLGGHICGVVGGSVSYFLLVKPATMINLSGLQSEAGFQIALGAGLAIFLTSLLMLLTRTSHPPACAITLIISLGFLPKVNDAVTIIFAVAVLYMLYHFLNLIIGEARKKTNFSTLNSKGESNEK